jgi:hypothetical protein
MISSTVTRPSPLQSPDMASALHSPRAMFGSEGRTQSSTLPNGDSSAAKQPTENSRQTKNEFFMQNRNATAEPPPGPKRLSFRGVIVSAKETSLGSVVFMRRARTRFTRMT